jgi:anti-sigma-K factor RskA
VTAEHDDVVSDLAAYALGSLSATEQARVEAHVATCTACAEQLASYRGIVGALPLALVPAPPPPGDRERMRAALHARSDVPSRPRSVPTSPDQPHRPRRVATAMDEPRGRRPVAMRIRWTRVARWWQVARWPAIAAVVIALGTWNLVLERRLTSPPPGPEVEALSRRPGRLVILRGAERPEANARIFVAVDGRHGHMAISGLRPLPRERTYQLWFVPKNAPAESGATFGVDARGRAWVTITVARLLDDMQAIIVTEEPAPGGGAPTGAPLLAAEPRR